MPNNATKDASDNRDPGQVTRILACLNAGEAGAADRLLELLYRELRRLAAWKMAQESPGHTLQPTALVHEAWLRLTPDQRNDWRNRAHFMASAAEAMRRILVDDARRKRQAKRGGNWERLSLDAMDLPEASPEDKILLVHEALDKFEALAPDEAQIVKLHFFVGLKQDEIAELLGLSERTVKRRWAFARAWLFRRIQEDQTGAE
jgi:RNA polymerase sigma factor (TIGR02999 family)